MRMDMKLEGLSPVIGLMSNMPGIQKRATLSALKFVTGKLRIKAKKMALPLWGGLSKGIVNLVFSDTVRGVVKIKANPKSKRTAIAVMLEAGRTLPVNPRMRAKLRYLGYRIRNSTPSVTVKPRPVFGPLYAQEKPMIVPKFEKRFFVRLGQILKTSSKRRGWRWI